MTTKKNAVKTSKKPGKSSMNGKATGKPFSSIYQPTGEAKSEGKLKKKRGIELVKAILEFSFKGLNDSKVKKAAAQYFMIDENEITVETILHFRQVQKAIEKSDTNAYNAIMNRAFGLPKQEIDGNINHSGTVKQFFIVNGKKIEF